MQKIRTIKGTHDILPWEIHKWQKIEAVLRDVFSSFACKEVRTPVFEKTQLFARGVGEFSDIVSKEMYTFPDKGGDSLTLRPELTASVARSYIQHNYQQESSLHKLWYFGPLFRQERPQAGRQRQFHQYGIELIGSEHPEADAEVIDIAQSVYKKLGLKNWELHVNSIGSIEARKVYMDVLRDALEQHKTELCETCQGRFDGNILRLFDCKNPGCQEIMTKHAPSILDHLSDEDKEHFEQVKRLLDAAGIDYIINPALVRGLDYYTRTTFEIKGTALGAQDALCGGGRYDNLISDLDGPQTPAVGFAAGVERLVIAMDAEGLFDEDQSSIDLYIAPMDIKCLEGITPVVHDLRGKGFKVHVELMRRSVKAMMRDANRQKARWVGVIGEQELESGQLRLKNMAENEQVDIAINDIGENNRMTTFDFIKDYFKVAAPKIGIVLGSGLNNLLDSIDIEKTLSYDQIPDFPRSTVPGHEGSFVLGKTDGVQILAAKGRFHFYEGYDLETVLTIMKTFHAMGIEKVIVTNAAGLMNKAHKPGDILLINDCIDMTKQTKVLKAGTAVISEAEKSIAMKAAKEAEVEIGEGIYVWTTGPSYETPAEIEYFTSLGGDLVGMSTMPEIMWAREHGMLVFPFSCATNWAAGISKQPLTHEEVNETAQHVRKDLTNYILTLCKLIGD